MMKKTRGLAPAGLSVDSFFQSHELAAKLRPHLAKAHWDGVVGPQVSGVTQVEAVRDGVLFVRVKNSVWANELTLLKDDMLRRLNGVLGGRVITDIHFKASGLARAKKKPVKLSVDSPTDADLARIVLSSESRARVNAALIGITEEALRERIRRTMLRAARTSEWKRRQGWHPCRRCGSLAAPPPDDVPPKDPLCALCRAGVVWTFRAQDSV